MEGAEQQVTEERLVSEEQGEKHSAEGEASSEDSPVDKRPRLEESDVVVPFVVQPKIKDTPISSDASAMKDPAVALSLAASVSLPADKATFQEKPDLEAIAFAVQSALLVCIRYFLFLPVWVGLQMMLLDVVIQTCFADGWMDSRTRPPAA